MYLCGHGYACAFVCVFVCVCVCVHAHAFVYVHLCVCDVLEVHIEKFINWWLFSFFAVSLFCVYMCSLEFCFVSVLF